VTRSRTRSDRLEAAERCDAAGDDPLFDNAVAKDAVKALARSSVNAVRM
jgi:hypothetical protein